MVLIKTLPRGQIDGSLRSLAVIATALTSVSVAALSAMIF
jgi:hypothetical protein